MGIATNPNVLFPERASCWCALSALRKPYTSCGTRGIRTVFGLWSSSSCVSSRGNFFWRLFRISCTGNCPRPRAAPWNASCTASFWYRICRTRRMWTVCGLLPFWKCRTILKTRKFSARNRRRCRCCTVFGINWMYVQSVSGFF